MQQSIEIMKNHIIEILADNKPSLYLFGSVVLDDFKLGWSDIDLLCLTQTPITEDQADELVELRQRLLEQYPGNLYFRSFEGGLLSLIELLHKRPERVVYWGTSGQRITDKFVFDVFSTMELLDFGRLLYGEDIRSSIPYPTKTEIKEAVKDHYNMIRKYAIHTGRNLYSAGWLLDIARCLYTLQSGKIMAKTAAGEWALKNGLTPNPEVLQRTIRIRKNPCLYKEDAATLDWCESLGTDIQRFADVLEGQMPDRCDVYSS